MTQQDERIVVASRLRKKLRAEVLAHAKPIPESDGDLSEALEPWIVIRQGHRTLELHIRDGGDVEFHVFEPGTKHRPEELLFVCDDKDYDRFTTDLADTLDRLARANSR